jgi:hypothetical protein
MCPFSQEGDGGLRARVLILTSPSDPGVYAAGWRVPLLAFSAAIVTPMRVFLGRKAHPGEVVDRMYDAWWKVMILTATLWSQPSMRDGDF